MIRQKSYQSSPILYLVPTPIGNLKDMTFRAVEVLKEVDIIFCEDTRVTKVLLSHFAIENEVISYHKYNEEEQGQKIIERLRNGQNVALVSDAGMPTISDPGYLICERAIEEGFNVVSLPGACAAITVLAASGLPTEQFMFFGFLDHKYSKKIKQLTSICDYQKTIIFYESPHRLIETLNAILEVLGNRSIAIGREISKKFEEYLRGKVSDILQEEITLKGEFVIVVHGANTLSLSDALNKMSLDEHIKYYLEQGNDEKEAMKNVAKDRNISKSEIYKQYKIDNKEGK